MMNLSGKQGDPPKTYNEFPVKCTWKGAGGKPTSITVIKHNGFRLTKCSNGYTLLCNDDSCFNLYSCRAHSVKEDKSRYCRNEGCTKHSSFGYEYKKPLFCGTHKASDMVNVKTPRCSFINCIKAPIYGYKHENAQYCAKHKIDGMINLKSKRCEYPDCVKTPNFALVGNRAQYCASHKTPEMVDVKNRKCLYPTCKTQPCYGYDGKIEYCFSHKLSDMIDFRNKHCIHLGCTVRAHFGLENNPPQYCFNHKADDMVNVLRKFCEHADCKTTASTNYENLPPKFCSKHKLDNMVDVVNKRCSFDDCKTNPCYGYDFKHPIFCAIHKLSDMIDVKNKTCMFSGCNILPCYGNKGGKRQYCFKHKLSEMINVAVKLCEYDNCNAIAIFGFDDRKRRFCSLHKLDFMKNLTIKYCEFDGCNITALYGFSNKIPQYCKAHKFPNMIDVVHDKCDFDDCRIRASYLSLFTNKAIHCREHATRNEYSHKKRNPMCTFLQCQNKAYYFDQSDNNLYPVRCDLHKLPNDMELVYKTCNNCCDDLYFPINKEVCMNCGLYRENEVFYFKESLIKQFLLSNNFQFIHNRPVTPSGSKCRPDFLIESKSGYICLEVDENQHNRSEYTSEREDERMVKIYQDVQLINSGAKVLFIRYNPDKYEGASYSDSDRLSYLHMVLTHFISIDDLVLRLSKVYLYYDGFDGNPQLQPLNITTHLTLHISV